MRAHLLGTLLTPALVLGIASTAIVGMRIDDPGPPASVPPDGAGATVVVDRAAHGVRGVETPLPAATLRGQGGATGVIRPGPFSHVAVTWRGPAPAVQVSTRTHGAWTGWRALDVLDDLDVREGDGTRGTHLVAVGSSDAVRARVSGSGARDLKVVTIDPGRTGTADSLALAADGTGPATATAVAATSSASPVSLAEPLPTPPAYTPPSRYAPAPYIRSRWRWGADESLRNGPPEYNRVIQQVHVHHTVSTNDYAKDAVPRLIRGMYWYHTQSLGWNDLGYNYLIDRFGRIWKGRLGAGVDSPVRGAHTLGFNHTSVGVSLIGNFERRAPSRYAVNALVRLAAWKADYWRRKPAGYVYVVSEGSDKYKAGTTVRLPVIDGHRHTNYTACPGRYLFAKLPDVRTRAQTRANNY